MLSFKDWIVQYKDVDMPMGDFASDVSRDPEYPKTESYKTLSNYFASKSLSEVSRLFEVAWKFYVELFPNK
jgi:uncharacterized protein YozE (UPF0346 family)